MKINVVTSLYFLHCKKNFVTSLEVLHSNKNSKSYCLFGKHISSTINSKNEILGGAVYTLEERRGSDITLIKKGRTITP